MNLIEFICQSNFATSHAQLESQWLEFLSEFGFDSFVVDGISQDFIEGSKGREMKDVDRDSKIRLTLHQPNSKTVELCFRSTNRPVTCNKNDYSLLYAASQQFLTVYSALQNKEDFAEVPIEITLREHEVLSWIAEGKSKAATARILDVSESCIKRHCENLSKKLGTNNLPSTVAKALRLGLLRAF